MPNHRYNDIEVGEPERHGHGLKDSYISYRVKSRLIDDGDLGEELNVARRYRDFLELQRALCSHLPSIILPPLPEKQSLKQILGSDRFGPEVIRRRQIGLQRWLQRLSRHCRVASSDVFREFMSASIMPMYSDSPSSPSCSQTGLATGDESVDNKGDFEAAQQEIALLVRHIRSVRHLSESWLRHEKGIDEYRNLR